MTRSIILCSSNEEKECAKNYIPVERKKVRDFVKSFFTILTENDLFTFSL